MRNCEREYAVDRSIANKDIFMIDIIDYNRYLYFLCNDDGFD